MKKIITLLLTLIFHFFCFSQVDELKFNHQNFDPLLPPRTNISPMSIRLLDNYENGGPTSYGTILEIYGLVHHQTSQLSFGGWDNSKIKYREAFYNQNTWGEWVTLLDSKNDVESNGNLKIKGNANSYILNGKVGIGTATPNSKLTIKGSGTGVSIHDGGNPYFGCIGFNRESATGEIFDPSAQAFQINNGGSDKNLHFQIYNGNGTQVTDNALVIKGTNGYVGIGTPNPDRELTVNGTIHSKEVIVDTTIPPDYVFQKYYTGKSELKSDYRMPALTEIEDFTRKNNHLPNVPSAKEMQENGILVGEMSNILLQKVEELTLYAIEQNKKTQSQQEEIERLKAENDQYKLLAERLAVIEKELKK